MGVLLRDHAASRGDRTALIDDHGSTTWTDLDERVNRLVHALRDRGLEPGDTDGAALSKRISSDIARWRRVAKAANIQPQ